MHAKLYDILCDIHVYCKLHNYHRAYRVWGHRIIAITSVLDNDIFLAVVHDKPCIPSLTLSTMYECCALNSIGALF